MKEEEEEEEESDCEKDVEITGVVDDEEIDERVCHTCGLIVVENEGYYACDHSSCHKIFHPHPNCFKISYNPRFDRRFVCKDCKRA